MGLFKLQEADRIEIMSLVDNYTDVLSTENSDTFKRPVITPSTPAPVAQHGLSCLLKLYRDTDEHFLLYDTGRSEIALMHNIEVLNVDLSKIATLTISEAFWLSWISQIRVYL